jgi:hypothetical protein
MAKFAVEEGRPRDLSLLGDAMFYLLFPLAVVGGFVLRRRQIPVFPLIATFAVVTLIAVAFYGWVRFRVPAEVAIVVLAGVAIDAWITRRQPLPTTVASA